MLTLLLVFFRQDYEIIGMLSNWILVQISLTDLSYPFSSARYFVMLWNTFLRLYSDLGPPSTLGRQNLSRRGCKSNALLSVIFMHSDGPDYPHIACMVTPCEAFVSAPVSRQTRWAVIDYYHATMTAYIPVFEPGKH